MTPFSSTSMPSAAGFLGRPGIVMILPITTTTKPAPAERRSSRTVIVKPEARPAARRRPRSCTASWRCTRQAAKAARVQLRKLLFCGGGKHHVRRAVYVFAYRADLVRHGRVVRIGEAHRTFFQNAQHILGQLQAARSAFCKHLAQRAGHAQPGAQVPQVLVLLGAVGGEGVDGHAHRHAEFALHVFHMAGQVRAAGLQIFKAGHAQLCLGAAAVVLERAHRGNDHNGGGLDAGQGGT